MNEKRKSKRINVDMALKISNIFRQDNVMIENIDAPIRVTNISKRGIGFETEAVLPVGYYFNAKITLGNKDSSLYTVVQIVRTETTEDSSNYYGCEFIGLSPILNFVFEDFNPGWDE
ncbi:MAG: PilZ domain-containing protein [Lachnospiraceae bacterium]|nr:PilZ domain-containing protein [Lachnospiraceae bacterium]